VEASIADSLEEAAASDRKASIRITAADGEKKKLNNRGETDFRKWKLTSLLPRNFPGSLNPGQHQRLFAFYQRR
jgi:hypothetical protein